MRDRLLVLAMLSFVIAVTGITVTSQSSTWTQLQTSWGDPDLQGIWTNENTGTPMQRPAKYGDREFLTDEEVAELMNWLLQSFSADQLPANFAPFSASEVRSLRANPESTPDAARQRILASIANDLPQLRKWIDPR